MVSWHLKTCSAVGTEECKHVFLTFTIDFRKLGRQLRKWFPSLSSSAIPIIDSVGRCLIIFKPCSAVPALKLLAPGRTQLSSCLAEELQQGSKRVVPELGPWSARIWAFGAGIDRQLGNLPWKEGW